MNVTLPANPIYFSLLEIAFGLAVIFFAAFQLKTNFKVELQTRYQKKIGLVVCLLIFFVILGVQLHLDLPKNKGYINYIYGAVLFVVLLEALQYVMNKGKALTLRNSGLIVMGMVFIYIGFMTWPK